MEVIQMSGKRRKRKFSPSGKTETIQSSPHPLLKKASDGYQNSLAGLGDASPLLSGGTFIKSSLSSNLELLTTLYRDSWIAKRIIDMPSEDMTRSWIRIISSLEDEDLSTLQQVMKRHNIRKE